jgi:hypothetical protein
LEFVFFQTALIKSINFRKGRFSAEWKTKTKCIAIVQILTQFEKKIQSDAQADWLFDLFAVLRPHQKCFTYMEISITIAGEWLQSLGRCLALRAFELRRIFIMPHML